MQQIIFGNFLSFLFFPKYQVYFHFHQNGKGRKWLFTQSCLTLSDPMDYSPPGSSVHGILHARIMEWVAIPFSRESS